jgi:Zn-dependent protease with chaperone function/uncharacterized tellurite resistance protein B-like protein
MDFFARQDRARRETKWLILYFTLAVISMIVLVYGIAIMVFNYFPMDHYYRMHLPASPTWGWAAFWNAKLFAEVVMVTLGIILCGMAWKTMELSGGGSAVAESLGGRLVATNTTNADERKLLNVVEEMAIASGVPMPQVYVLDDENGINAFAAGHSTSDAVVAVTRLCMTQLTRDELQGVIGHEFSHILNGDMKLNIRLIGILFGIFCVATLGRILMSVRSDRDGRNPFPLIGLVLLAVGSLGVFFGRLIQAAVSRQREFLADASSVQFTRNPVGLSGALQKVHGYGSFMEGSPHASDASHLFFASGLRSVFLGVMATHPPLEARIRAIDPAWDGTFPRPNLEEVRAENKIRAREPRVIFRDGRMIILSGAMAEAAAQSVPPPVVRSTAVLPNLGQPTPLHLKYAEDLRDALPDTLKETAREPLAAAALIYALLLGADEKLRAMQMDGIRNNFSTEVADRTAALYPQISQLAARAHLPLINLALGALKQLTAEQYAQFSRTLTWLVNSDGRVELFEFVLQKIVRRHLAPKFEEARPVTPQFYTVKPLLPDCQVILSALARVGSRVEAEVQKAFDAGVPYLRASEFSLTLLPREACGVDAISAALDRTAQALPVIKKSLLEACAQVVGADGIIQETEAELLRAVADTLDCPIPPLGVTE